ncbi:hypothetical protein V2J09_019363 [Rumex salicifolius]
MLIKMAPWYCLSGSAASNGSILRNRMSSLNPPLQSSILGRTCVSSLKLRACFSSASHGHGVGYPSSLKCAVLGAGFAGLSVTWHLLQNSPKEMNLQVDVFDEVGIGGGASGVSGGLLHPYSPKVKLLWKGEECWNECLSLLNVAEQAAGYGESTKDNTSFNRSNGFIVRRSGILRPAVSEKYLDIMHQNAENSLASCEIETIDKDAAKHLVPNLCTPLNAAFFMPKAVNVNPKNYLQALFLACQKLVSTMSESGCAQTSLCLHKKSITSINDLAGEYDAVIICLGAKADMLPELSGMLPLRMCRGIIAHLQLPDYSSEEYPDESPSILSDAWMAVQGPRKLHLGSTWEWGSRNYSTAASTEETSLALKELLPKARNVYPIIEKWRVEGVRAGLRAMPPVTLYGSLPLVGSIDDLVGSKGESRYWIIGGLGSRGLLYHGWVGKLTAQAVLAGNPALIPSELSSWRTKKKG